MKKEMTREELDEQTREDWRELGFFYEYDKTHRCWRLVGSRQGLLNFCAVLTEYAADARNASLSEHEHYGPYWYLKIVTWSEALITTRDIRGTLNDLQRLAKIVEEKLGHFAAGENFLIDTEYSANNEAPMIFEIKEDDFDAATADPLL